MFLYPPSAAPPTAKPVGGAAIGEYKQYYVNFFLCDRLNLKSPFATYAQVHCRQPDAICAVHTVQLCAYSLNQLNRMTCV